MNYIYRNDTKHTILYRNYYWLPHDSIPTSFPIPEDIGLTCIKTGSLFDPVLFHDDVSVPAGQKVTISLNSPAWSHNVCLSLQSMTSSSGCECRFVTEDNNPIPIDVRPFSQTLPWSLCSLIFLYNPTDSDCVISVTAMEVAL